MTHVAQTQPRRLQNGDHLRSGLNETGRHGDLQRPRSRQEETATRWSPLAFQERLHPTGRHHPRQRPTRKGDRSVIGARSQDQRARNQARRHARPMQGQLPARPVRCRERAPDQRVAQNSSRAAGKPAQGGIRLATVPRCSLPKEGIRRLLEVLAARSGLSIDQDGLDARLRCGHGCGDARRPCADDSQLDTINHAAARTGRSESPCRARPPSRTRARSARRRRSPGTRSRFPCRRRRRAARPALPCIGRPESLQPADTAATVSPANAETARPSMLTVIADSRRADDPIGHAISHAGRSPGRAKMVSDPDRFGLCRPTAPPCCRSTARRSPST